jgi:hypothetical protein
MEKLTGRRSQRTVATLAITCEFPPNVAKGISRRPRVHMFLLVLVGARVFTTRGKLVHMDLRRLNVPAHGSESKRKVKMEKGNPG